MPDSNENSAKNIKKSRGRPRIDATPIGLRLAPEQLQRLDAWIAQQADRPTRPEAIRRLIEAGLAAREKIPIKNRQAAGAKGEPITSIEETEANLRVTEKRLSVCMARIDRCEATGRHEEAR